MNNCDRCDDNSNDLVFCKTCQNQFCDKCRLFPPKDVNDEYECIKCSTGLSGKPIERLIPNYYPYLSEQKQNMIITTLICFKKINPTPPKYIRLFILNCIFDDLKYIEQIIENPCHYLFGFSFCSYPTKSNKLCQSCQSRHSSISDDPEKCQSPMVSKSIEKCNNCFDQCGVHHKKTCHICFLEYHNCWFCEYESHIRQMSNDTCKSCYIINN